MITIVYLRKAEPKFSAESRNPGAVRYYVAPYWVDAVGGEPTREQIEATINPPPPPPPAMVSLEQIAIEHGGAAWDRRQFEERAKIDPLGALLQKEGIES